MDKPGVPRYIVVLLAHSVENVLGFSQGVSSRVEVERQGRVHEGQLRCSLSEREMCAG